MLLRVNAGGRVDGDTIKLVDVVRSLAKTTIGRNDRQAAVGEIGV